MRLMFFGSDPWFSPPVFERLVAAGYEVPLVVTKGDVFGKGQGLKAKGQRTKDKGQREIKIIQAKTSADITKEKLVYYFRRTRPDAVILASFGPPFLPAEVLNWPKYGALNVHASLLPRWRGASPVFAAIAAGDKETGVTIMKMTEKVDRGPILSNAKQSISPTETRESLTKKLGKLGGELIVDTIKKLESGQITEVKQPEKSPTFYTRRLTKDSGLIDWSLHPGETDLERSRRIERFIRAVTPWPGAWTEYRDKGQGTRDKGKILKILRASLTPSSLSPQPSALSPILVQLPGKSPIPWKQFLVGHPQVKFST